MDLGVQYTDRELLILERKIKKIYEEAEKDLIDKMTEYNRKRNIKDSIRLQELKNGKITQEEYNRWRAGQNFQGKQWLVKREQIANVLYEANSEALKIINGGTISVFNENANYAAYLLEKRAGVNFGFGLYDANTVTNLIKNDPNILPFKKLNKTKDVRWNFKKIRGQITQGIIQGESLEKIAKRIATVTGSQNRRQMMTHARTAMTSAQNAGRQIRYTEAAEKGIELHKEWMATFDTHTRDAHRQLDGQKVPVDKPFKVDGYEINFPGDPHAQPYLVYNCRCTMVADLDSYPSIYQRYDNINRKPVSQMTYKEWYDSKNEPVYTDFLEIRKSLGNEFVNGMETLLNFTEEEDVKHLFYTNQSRLKVTDANETGGAYFSHSDGGVHINANKVSQGDDLHLPMQTAFHEFGHNLDYIGDGKWHSREYKNGALEKKLKEDWNEFRVKYIKENKTWEDYEIRSMLRDMDDKEGGYRDSIWYDLVRKHRSGEITTSEILGKYGDKIARAYVNKDSNTKWFIDYDIVKSLKEENIPLSARGSISDIMGGLFNSRGKSDSMSSYPLGAGHGKDYWWKYKVTKSGELIKVSNNNLPLEFFAEVCDGKATNPDSLAQMRRIFPKSVKIVEEIIQEMIK